MNVNNIINAIETIKLIHANTHSVINTIAFVMGKNNRIFSVSINDILWDAIHYGVIEREQNIKFINGNRFGRGLGDYFVGSFIYKKYKIEYAYGDDCGETLFWHDGYIRESSQWVNVSHNRIKPLIMKITSLLSAVLKQDYFSTKIKREIGLELANKRYIDLGYSNSKEYKEEHERAANLFNPLIEHRRLLEKEALMQLKITDELIKDVERSQKSGREIVLLLEKHTRKEEIKMLNSMIEL